MIERPQIIPLRPFVAVRDVVVVINSAGRTFRLDAGRQALLDAELNADLIRRGVLVEQHEAGRRRYPEGHPLSEGWSA